MARRSLDPVLSLGDLLNTTWSRRRLLGAALLLGAGGSARALHGEEARVKARLALTLARFTQWSASTWATPADMLSMCLLHRSAPLSEAFSSLAGQTVNGRALRILNNPDKLSGICQVVFVHETAESDAESALKAISSSSILTIGDGEGFAARGGMVELVNVNDAIKLDINLRAMRQAQIGLSSQVLKLARQVRE